ncbi:MAG: CaiB/BaiF CoA-transferase family protein [Alphaproteobacteria bacterium]|jgi:crotonobetainyl-CoA:carnitine CoA-transferase CaiB-like acyl-CoA transferase|nr:formyl-CoA transferase [Rhodospirillaceae bacterium]MDP6021392.1 CaiB/BaiF CoA-transferase family protein [Alphaproteobacteria bacterium]MDP6256723.1 CaiB/BaiF CoA-transferase family protein [Alphaproteobacteria bacterium]MDP7056601.1 CaiB/BaiF CoA-transferase family protein [Alphaproteobacteria bacterium]MDP7230318.1 CaiB/BaiF CoA-transferase family protein [Alphaproteobacteria bacterium]|tara:strand:- start:548 stop:1729 length:1182 start_codon:yes stop_codon:yes gene_type:complete
MNSDFAPLKDVRVVEMSHMIMGPSCGMFLSFLGAEVIKVEPPEGDKTRQLSGMGRGFFPTFNRGKKSVQLDLKTTAGIEALNRLLATADVFVENFRDTSLANMGLDPGSLREKYPRLIVASCKGFLHGPYENRTAMDEVVQMMTGMAHMTGPSGRPLRIGSSANDIMGGLFGALSVLGALLERDKTDAGHSIRIGLFENCLLLVAQHMVQFDIEGTEAPPMPERVFSWPVYDIFKTREERQIFVGSVTEGQWDKLCTILQLDKLLNDPGLRSRQDQIAARSRTIPIFEKAIAQRSFDELLPRFEADGIPFSPISRPVEMYDDPHVNREGGLFVSNLPEGGSFRAPGLPMEVDGLPVCGNIPDLPGIGEDTAEILNSLGLTEAEVAAAAGLKEE